MSLPFASKAPVSLIPNTSFQVAELLPPAWLLATVGAVW